MRKLFIISAFLWCSTAFGAWTAKPLSKEIVDGKLVVFVGYTNGTTVLTRYHKIDTYEQFLAETKAEVARLDGIDSAFAKVEVGTIIDISDKPPSQSDLDRTAFIVLIQNYRAKFAEVKSGIGKSTQADVDAAIADIKAAYKDEYAPLLLGVF